jgi:hypothetical protein
MSPQLFKSIVKYLKKRTPEMLSDLLVPEPDQVPAAVASYKWTLDVTRVVNP